MMQRHDVNKPDHVRLTLRVEVEKWPLKPPFRITGHTWTNLRGVVVAIEQDGCVGRDDAPRAADGRRG